MIYVSAISPPLTVPQKHCDQPRPHSWVMSIFPHLLGVRTPGRNQAWISGGRLVIRNEAVKMSSVELWRL